MIMYIVQNFFSYLDNGKTPYTYKYNVVLKEQHAKN